jgi:hypothetical protein
MPDDIRRPDDDDLEDTDEVPERGIGESDEEFDRDDETDEEEDEEEIDSPRDIGDDRGFASPAALGGPHEC